MLTEEQIKVLKPGDPLIVKGTYVKQYSNGDIVIKCNITAGGKLTPDLKYFNPMCVSLTSDSQPKYDPCRLLRKGDRVQVKKRNGRCNGKDGEYLREAFCEVADDEVPNELVRVYHNSSEYRLDPAYLELVTPVEELEPYTVDGCGFAPTFYVLKYGKVYMTIPYKEGSSLFQTREEAKEAAEAECNRLNDEWKKDHNCNQN